MACEIDGQYLTVVTSEAKLAAKQDELETLKKTNASALGLDVGAGSGESNAVGQDSASSGDGNPDSGNLGPSVDSNTIGKELVLPRLDTTSPRTAKLANGLKKITIKQG